LILWIFAILIGLPVLASPPLAEDRGTAAAWQHLQRVQSNLRILYIVAHPDDEDAPLLTLLARRHAASVTLLSLTRGESGANLITGDFFDRLGALRTLEHLRAAQSYGVDIRYTRFADFGYSKNVEETWRNWDREEVLRDVVRQVRTLRPHIILTRWQGTPRDGHGHHHAAGLLAREAFDAAADPRRFKDQNLAPWQALKLYTGNWRKDDPGVLAIDTGLYDPVLGRTYAEIGREGYRFQRSQSMGNVVNRPGPAISYYLRAACKVSAPTPEIFLSDGTKSFTAPPPTVASLGRRALEVFTPDHPEASAPFLADAISEIRRLRAASPDPDLEEWEARYTQALHSLLGVQLQVTTSSHAVTEGQELDLAADWQARANSGAELIGYRMPSQPPNLDGKFHLRVKGAAPTAAGWRRDSPRQPQYTYSQNFGLPLPAPPFVVEADYRYRNLGLTVQQAADVVVAPRLAVQFSTQSVFSPVASRSFSTEVLVRNTSSRESEGSLRLNLPAGWRATPDQAAFRFSRPNEEMRFQFEVEPPANAAAAEFRLTAAAEVEGVVFQRGFERITYSDLGSLYLDPPADLSVRLVDVRLPPNLTIGYVMGSGDEVPATLRQLGARVDLLDANALASADLSRYNVILLGIRAYAARPELPAHNSRLLNYVANGGVLIVQYNTQEYDREYGPYPYSMTMRAEEVSEEDAPVSLLAPDHPVFHQPNEIRSEDWQGWFEQRGSKFFSTWDPRYQPMVETHDTGQAPQRGVWLQARYGKGLYVYCALAWYRQLPFGVPGAVRLFANLVSQRP
jgi:LmbE family N-acetylglucosaminyl deacetylase